MYCKLKETRKSEKELHDIHDTMRLENSSKLPKLNMPDTLLKNTAWFMTFYDNTIKFFRNGKMHLGGQEGNWEVSENKEFLHFRNKSAPNDVSRSILHRNGKYYSYIIWSKEVDSIEIIPQSKIYWDTC